MHAVASRAVYLPGRSLNAVSRSRDGAAGSAG